MGHFHVCASSKGLYGHVSVHLTHQSLSAVRIIVWIQEFFICFHKLSKTEDCRFGIDEQAPGFENAGIEPTRVYFLVIYTLKMAGM